MDHRPDGKVSMQLADGSRIDGQFRHGMPHGRAVWRTPGGLRVDAMYRMGRPHGQVRVYNEQGQLVYEGRFINGRPVNRETMPEGLDKQIEGAFSSV